MTSAERRKTRRIPAFKTKEAEARFWDTNDFTDYAREFKPVRVRFAKNLSRGITIRLDPETLATLRSQALEKGMGPTTLVRMWILERLREQKGKVASATRECGVPEKAA